MKNEFNDYHDGGHFHHLEVLDLVLTSENAWATHKDLKGIRKDSCPTKGPLRYDKLYEDFIFKHYPREFGTVEIWQAAKVVKHTLDDLKIYAWYKNHMEEHCDFFIEKTGVVIQNLAFTLPKILQFQDAHPMLCIQAAPLYTSMFLFVHTFTFVFITKPHTQSPNNSFPSLVASTDSPTL